MAADELAADSRDMHPALDSDLFCKAKKHYFMAKNVLLLAARALPEWQASRQGGKQHHREEVLAQRSQLKHRREQEQAREQLPHPFLTADGGHF